MLENLQACWIKSLNGTLMAQNLNNLLIARVAEGEAFDPHDFTC